MEEFKNNIFNIYNLINDDKHENSLVNAKIISKQYLAYYIYRIVTKYMYLVEQSSPSKDIDFFFSLLRIPTEHDKHLNYPISGKLSNEGDLLNMIILSGIQMFEKIDNYLKTLNNKNKQNKYKSFYTFMEEKTVSAIIKDIMDLQKLLPGLSVPIIRPNYLDDAQL
jgi:hypothetical protein